MKDKKWIGGSGNQYIEDPTKFRDKSPKKKYYAVNEGGKLVDIMMTPADAKKFGWHLTPEKAINAEITEYRLQIGSLKNRIKYLQDLKNELPEV